MTWMKRALLAIASSLLIAGTASGAEPVPTPQPYWVEQLADGLQAPWSMAWLPNGDMLIVEKFGGIRLFHKGKLNPKPIAGVPAAYQASTDGLLDIALDPDFATNHRVFLSFTEGTYTQARGAVLRARFTGDALVDGRVIFRTTPDGEVGRFNIVGRILFLPDKTFLLASSDDELRHYLVQKLDNDQGKILRLDRDGNPPPDNPFIGKPGVRPEIYAYGVRSPLGLTRDPRTGRIWENENGPKGGDELNEIKPGANYGWPIQTYGTEYNGEKMSFVGDTSNVSIPLVYWVPSIAPSGLAINTGDRYPQWKGDYFVGALAGRHLQRVRLEDDKPVAQEMLMTDLKERIRDVRLGPDGYLYALTDNTEGRLFRLRPGSPSAREEALVAKRLDKGQPTTSVKYIKITPGDPTLGKTVFDDHCASCHAVDAKASGKDGPSLFGVFKRRAGMLAGFDFSPAMQELHIRWDTSGLDYFLASPAGFLPATSMTTLPVEDRKERADLIGYLKSISPDGSNDSPD